MWPSVANLSCVQVCTQQQLNGTPDSLVVWEEQWSNNFKNHAVCSQHYIYTARSYMILLCNFCILTSCELTIVLEDFDGHFSVIFPPAAVNISKVATAEHLLKSELFFRQLPLIDCGGWQNLQLRPFLQKHESVVSGRKFTNTCHFMRTILTYSLG